MFKRFMGGRKDASASKVNAVEPRHLTSEEFDAVILKSELPAVVDLWAEWCGPCHAIAPAVADLACEFNGRAVVAKLNADECPDIVTRYGIMGIPTVIYFKNGREVDRVIGLTGYSTLKAKLERLLD